MPDLKDQKLRQQLTILGCMYLGYGGMMVCRQTVVILSPAMMADPDLEFTEVDYANIVGWGGVGAILGKFLWGPLADALGGRRTFLVALVVSAAFLIAFGITRYAALFGALTFVVWCAKSGGWPAMAKLIENWYHPRKYGRVWGVLSTSSRASVVIGTLVLGGLLRVLSWQAVAVCSGAVSVLLLFLCLGFLRNGPSDPDFLVADEADEQEPEAHVALEHKLHHPLAGTTLREGLLAFASSYRVWLICLSIMALTVLMEFLTYVPLYLQGNFDLGDDPIEMASRAATASAAFPAGSLLGVLAGGFLFDGVSRRNRRGVLGGMLVVAVLCILGLMWVPNSGLPASQGYWITLGVIFLFGLAISPAYYLPMSVFSIEFGGIHSGVLICLIDAAGFGAGTLFGFVGGRIAREYGWGYFMSLLLVVAIAAVVLMVAFLHAEYRALQAQEKQLATRTQSA